jgi:hypothetical protein
LQAHFLRILLRYLLRVLLRHLLRILLRYLLRILLRHFLRILLCYLLRVLLRHSLRILLRHLLRILPRYLPRHLLLHLLRPCHLLHKPAHDRLHGLWHVVRYALCHVPVSGQSRHALRALPRHLSGKRAHELYCQLHPYQDPRGQARPRRGLALAQDRRR